MIYECGRGRNRVGTGWERNRVARPYRSSCMGLNVQKGALDPSNVPAAHVAPVLGVRGGANAFNPALVMGMQC